MEDASQVGGGQRNKREEGECETSRWRAMQGNRAVNDITRGGGRMPAIILKTTTAMTMQNLHQRKQRNQADIPLHPPGGIQDPRIVSLFFVHWGGHIAIANAGSHWRH